MASLAYWDAPRTLQQAETKSLLATSITTSKILTTSQYGDQAHPNLKRPLQQALRMLIRAIKFVAHLTMIFARRSAVIPPGTTPEQMERLRSIIGSMSANPTAGEPGLFHSHSHEIQY